MDPKTALFPGSFDPITKGHVDIIKKGLLIFDRIVVAIGKNSKKNNLFDIDQRAEWIRQVFKDEKRVSVETYDGLTIEFCKKINAGFILRGLRSPGDFEYEQNIAYANKELVPDIETVFLLSGLSYSNISSTIVREVIIHKGDYTKFVPEGIVFKDIF
ncbi:MAG: pantetheine-phosphate adenylyltransferase [Bacteroidia bacterium]|nr:pantetheine-phosphate adenylyltransferase [Bacteroidia bacterium]